MPEMLRVALSGAHEDPQSCRETSANPLEQSQNPEGLWGEDWKQASPVQRRYRSYSQWGLFPNEFSTCINCPWNHKPLIHTWGGRKGKEGWEMGRRGAHEAGERGDKLGGAPRSHLLLPCLPPACPQGWRVVGSQWWLAERLGGLGECSMGGAASLGTDPDKGHVKGASCFPRCQPPPPPPVGHPVKQQVLIS